MVNRWRNRKVTWWTCGNCGARNFPEATSCVICPDGTAASINARVAHIMIHRQTLLHRHIHGLLKPIFEELHR